MASLNLQTDIFVLSQSLEMSSSDKELGLNVRT